MEKKGSFFILLVIIAVLTLIVAVLAAFIILVGINPPQAAAITNDQAIGSRSEVTVIDEKLISTRKLFSEKQFFNLKSSDGKMAICMVNVTIKYINKLDGIKDVEAKMQVNEDNLKEIVSSYFKGLTYDQIEKLETKLQAKEDLKNEMNVFLLSTIEKESDRRKVGEIVYEIIFSEWNYQKQ